MKAGPADGAKLTDQGAKTSSTKTTEETTKRGKVEEKQNDDEGGIKGSIDEWGKFAKKLRPRAEEKAEESN